MARNEGKSRSVRQALRDVSNNNINHINSSTGGGGRFSKSVNVNKKSFSEKLIENKQKKEADGGEEDYLDRLLLVQSDFSSLTGQIDELVAQAFKVKVTSKLGRREIESFSHVLSDMLSSLKPWVPRLQKALSSPAESENQLGRCLADETVSALNEDQNFEVESPEQTRMNSLISPSPLVSWRADCNIERGKQLFLLTPLPISKTLSSKGQDLAKSVFERITSNPAVEVSSFLPVSEDVNDDLLEGIVIKPAPNKPSNSGMTEANSTPDSECVSPPIISKTDQSILVMTPCLKMSPPKSCILLEPISESSNKNKTKVRKSTPFPVGMRSDFSESSSDSEGSEALAFKYLELLGIQPGYKSRAGKKEFKASPKWFFSPPKTCVLLEPPDEKSPDTVVAADNHLPISAPVLNQQTNLDLSKEYNDQSGCLEIEKSSNQEPISGNLTLVESTPLWKEPESTMRRGKCPGENTLKKELWTKFEAASTYGLRLNVSTLQRTAQKGFLDMLDEVSREGEVLKLLNPHLPVSWNSQNPKVFFTKNAKPSQLIQHIESFVDSSRSTTQQAASLDAIVSLLKDDALTIGSLVKEMEIYLTTTDDILRARGILLLGEALVRLTSMKLDNSTVHSLITFFTERLADWRALHGALVGCLALIRRKNSGMVTGTDAKAVAESYLQNLQVQSLAQHDRKLCFELLECLLEHYPVDVASMGEDLIYGVCEAIDGEKDPQCLMLTFHVVELLVQLFSDPSGPISSFAGDLFGILGCYFPIHFTHPKAEDIEVKRDDLSRALMLAFSCTPLFEPFAMPLLLEKLSSSLPSAKVDSLKYLSYCTLKFGADRIVKHAEAIWSSLKDAIYSSGEDPMPTLNSESLGDSNFKKNEITEEALGLLEKLIIQNNDLFLRMVIDDEEINIIFNTITSYRIYNEISLQSKQKLHMVGRILHVSAKAAVSSCNKISGSFFPRLMEALGCSVETTSGSGHLNENHVKSKQPNYGSFYLCVQILGACRDLVTSSENLTSQCVSANETCCSLLQSFSSSLTKIFISTLSRCTNGPDHNADMYLGVKGLQILATFPGDHLLISKWTFDNILMTFISIITMDFNKTLLWKQVLKALVYIGSFVQGCDQSEMAIRYMDIIVDKIIMLALSADFTVPWPLKLTAISSIGTSGPKCMLKIVLGLEDAIHANLAEFYVQGNQNSAKIILQLLECFSNELLPWIQKNGGFEEVLLQFVVNMWNQIENCVAFSIDVHEKEPLSAIMNAMKLAVACCSVESQNIIVQKAYSVLSSSAEFSSIIPFQLERFEPTNEMTKFSSRDEWIHSLFASVIIALRPQAHIPNTRMILHFFTATLLKGYVIAAQALGSLVNKLDLKSSTGISGDRNFEEEIDMIFSTILLNLLSNGSFGKCDRTSNGDEMGLSNFCLGAANCALQIHSLIGLAWIGKGLLMRGHEKVQDMTMVFLKCLLSDSGNALPLKQGSLENNCNQEVDQSVIKSAADAFQILMSHSEICQNRKFHAVLKPLYKQRFFSTVMPILQSLITKADSSCSRSMLYRAFAHVISDTPLIVILNDAKKLIPMLLDGLTLLGKDVMDKDIIYGLLLVLSGILTDKTGQEAVVENAYIIIKCLIELVAYPHIMLVRETAIQCLVAMTELPYTRIYPLRIQVLQAMAKALDDPKRAVRRETVRCRQAWASIASRSLHF